MMLNGNWFVSRRQEQPQTKSQNTIQRLIAIVSCSSLLLIACAPLLGQQVPKKHLAENSSNIRRIPRPPAVDNNDSVPVSNQTNSSAAGGVTYDKMVYQVSHESEIVNTKEPSHDRRTSSVSDHYEYPWTYKLKNLTYGQFEAKLTEIWGERLMGTALDEEKRMLRLYLPEGNTAPEASLKFDRVAGTITYEGAPSRKRGWYLLMQLLDRVERPNDKYGVKVIDIGLADQSFVRQVSHSIQGQDQDQDQGELPIPQTLTPQDLDALRQEIPKLQGTIEIRISEETGTFILRGPQEDIDKLKKFIDEVLMNRAMVDKESKSIQLFNAEPDDLQEKIQQAYDDQFAGVHGPAQIVSNPSGNSLLVVGSAGAIKVIEKMARDFDGDPQDVDPADPPAELTEREKGFKTFVLKYISAIEAQNAVLTLFGQNNNQVQAEQRQALPISTQVNQRTNALTVIGSPRLIRRAEALIKDIDVDPGDPANKRAKRVLRVFPIRNHRAGDFAVILQDALNGGQQQNLGLTESQLQQTNFNQNQQQTLNDGTNQPISPIASLSIADEEGNPGRAGDFFDVRITADNPSNSIIVNAREDSMDLIEQLIRQLDKAPGIFSEVKVFPIINGDATEVLNTLQDLFLGDQTGGAGGQTPGSLADLPLQSPASDGSSLINIRFAVNERTNTIIASGSQSDLEFVEALIYRLDEKDVQDRQTGVYRLSNANVVDVATAIQDMLDARQAVTDANPLSGGGTNNQGVISARRNVVIVEEETSNSLIVNARPEYFPEIEHLIYALDRRPPMVKVKAMIVQVDLNQLENFGIEFGIQDSSIFDAGVVDTIGTGFVGLDNPAGQLLSDLGVGRASATAGGISGLILSAGDESLNFVIRSLKQKGCANILFSPEVMTLENLTGAFERGAQIQRLGGINTTVGAGTQQSVNDVNIGISLSITPRVTPDGMIVMFVDVSNTSLGSAADGTSLGTDANGNQIISQPINLTTAQTTIMARSGQTVAISGLFQEQKTQNINSVPFLGDLPVIGPLFQSIENNAERNELLIILTPYIVNGPEDIDRLNEDDFNRMHWCKCDVAELYGDTEFRGEPYYEHTPKVFYPDTDPTASNPEFENATEVYDNGDLQNGFSESNEPLIPEADRWQPREEGSGSRNGFESLEGPGGQHELPMPQSNWQSRPMQQNSSSYQGSPVSSYDPRNQNQPPPPPMVNRNYLPTQQSAPQGPLPPMQNSNMLPASQDQHNLNDRSIAAQNSYSRTQQRMPLDPIYPANYAAQNGQYSQNQNHLGTAMHPNRPVPNSRGDRVHDQATGMRYRLLNTTNR